MILLSVGTQLPFDRLIRSVERWALEQGRSDVVAQVGPTDYAPIGMRSFRFMEHGPFRQLQEECSLMISHAGMGSIITAMELGKPIVIMARDHRRGEHRNGHQMATLRQFANVPGVYPAADEAQLLGWLEMADKLTATPSAEAEAPKEFVARLAEYIRAPRDRALLRRLCTFFQ